MKAYVLALSFVVASSASDAQQTRALSPAELRAMSAEELRERYALPPFAISGVKTDPAAVEAAARARCNEDPKCRAEFIAGFERLKTDWYRSSRKPHVERVIRAATQRSTDWQLGADHYEAEFPLATDPARVEASYQADRASVRRHCEKVLQPMGDPAANSAVTLEACINGELAARQRLRQ
jgi:hypothetical protein